MTTPTKITPPPASTAASEGSGAAGSGGAGTTLSSGAADPFSSYAFKRGPVLRNRVVLAPMTNGQSNADGTVGADEAHWLLERARGGFGALVTAAAHVREDAQAWEGQIGVYGTEHVEGLSQLAAAVAREGAALLAQLYHGGARTPSRLTRKRPVSASEWRLEVPDFEVPRALEEEEIHALVADFAAAAKRCASAGMRGVEVHGANGYLFTQFLSTQSNTRTDSWGGGIEGRARFLREVVRAIRAAVPAGFLVGVRLSPENAGSQAGLRIDESLAVARWLAEDGIDFFHLSLGDFAKLPSEDAAPRTPVVTLFREALPPGVALMTSGGIWELEHAREAMALGADLVSLGKAAIIHPDWPRKAATPGFTASRMPWERASLAAAGVGDTFLRYLERMRLVKT